VGVCIFAFRNPQAGLAYATGTVNSLLTLLMAAIVSAVAWFIFRQKNKVNKWPVGTAIILVGFYFVAYDLVSVWVPVYRSFIPLTDFWMITLRILGAAYCFDGFLLIFGKS
jgi:LPXTG-motif cell wall-anchored protein